MTGSTGASRRHVQRQLAVVVGLVGAALTLLAGGLALGADAVAGARQDAPLSSAGVTAPAGPRSGAAAAVEPDPTVITSSPAPRSAGPTTAASPPAPTVAPSDAPAPRPGSVEIPVIGVLSDLVDLDLDESRHLEVPSDVDLAGWYVRGPRPGEDGPAVIAGHVDSTRGPAVFWRLRDLQPGDEVRIHRVDGSMVTFVVDRLGRWPKSEFPTDEVYRRADGPELRLITCGGAFDDRAGSYLDNVVVFASLAAAT